MKKLKLLLSTMLILALLSTNAFAFSYQQLEIDGVNQTLSKSIIQTETNVFVSLRELAGNLGYSVEWNAEERAVSLKQESDEYLFWPESNLVKINDYMQRTMSSAAYIENGVMYIPLNAVVDVFDLSLEKGTDAYKINTGVSDAVGSGYTVDELYQLALENSEDLRSAEETVERSEITQDEVQDSVSSSSVQSQRQAMWTAYYSQGIALEMAKKNVETTKDGIYHDLLTAIETILVETNNLKVAEANRDVLKTTYDQSKLKYELGLISSIDLDTARINYENAAKSLEMQELTIKSAWVDFNTMVGMAAESRINFAYSLTFDKLTDRDLEAHITDMLQNSPSIWNLEQQIELAELGTRFYVFNAGSDPYEAEEIDITLAKINLKNAKDQLDVSLRTLYNTIETLESNQTSLELKVKDAENTLNLARTNYDVGLATLLDVESAELALISAKQNALSNIATYLQTVRVYEETWVN